MSGDVEMTRKRETLKGVYKSDDWVQKVKKMSDTQVTAIYLRLKAQNKI